MSDWQYLLVFGAGIFLILAWICHAGRKQNVCNYQEFLRKLDSLLLPKETVLTVCPQKGGYCVLTNTRMLLEKRGTFTAFWLKDLRSVQGKNKEGNRTTVPANMVTLTVRFGQNVVLRNTGSEFEMLAKQLQEKVKKKPQQNQAASRKRKAAK